MKTFPKRLTLNSIKHVKNNTSMVFWNYCRILEKVTLKQERSYLRQKNLLLLRQIHQDLLFRINAFPLIDLNVTELVFQVQKKITFLRKTPF